MKIGDKIFIKKGTTEWMKEHGFWLDSMPNNIDEIEGEIINDYTNLGGNNSHYEVSIGIEYGVGIHPQWLKIMN